MLSESNLFPITDAQVLPDADAGLCLVKGVKVQARRTGPEQLFTHVSDHFFAELADGVAVVAPSACRKTGGTACDIPARSPRSNKLPAVYGPGGKIRMPLASPGETVATTP